MFPVSSLRESELQYGSSWSPSSIFLFIYINNSVSLGTIKTHTFPILKIFYNTHFYITSELQNEPPLNSKAILQRVSCCPKFFWLKATGVFADDCYHGICITTARQSRMYGACQEQPQNCLSTTHTLRNLWNWSWWIEFPINREHPGIKPWTSIAFKQGIQ